MLREAGHPAVQPRPERHRHGSGCGHRDARQAETTDTAPVQRSTVHDVLRTPGRAMDDATRTDMEARLGADFSDVRIHDGSAAAASAAEVGARAYTSGNHVVIGAGGTDRHTLAHELTHVIQQRQGPVAGTDNGTGLKVSDPADRFEREAEANAKRALATTPPAHAPAGTPAGSGQDAPPVHGRPHLQRTKTKEVPAAATKRAMDKMTADWTQMPYAGGKWPDTVENSPKRRMDADEQALRHVARQFFNSGKAYIAEDGNQETQVMHVGGGILVACNDNGTSAEILKTLQTRTLADVMRDSHGAGNDARAQRSADYMTNLGEGNGKEGAVNTFMTTAMAVQDGVLAAQTATEAAATIGGGHMDGKIVFIHSGFEELHAEQKLVLALLQSGSTGAATIVGKKRPCTSCFLSLSIAKHKKLPQLTFQTKPGGYWTTANPGLTKIGNAAGVKDEKELDELIQKYKPATVHRTGPDGNQQYGTDSEASDVEMAG
ncbi:DUF4157 domain-containing protein [Streptomyces sp. SID9727]|uniref:eCIS core domain-containing protein n=1 Tax=Streptomyces sp. SID9727 TaxID=2706114 RepID=UPI001EF3963E|nr:DUF4157 domain-containing protein [Streptomyces sp. SID9727]